MNTRAKVHGYVVICDRFGILQPTTHCNARERGVLFSTGPRVHPFRTRQQARRAIAKTQRFATRAGYTEWLNYRYRIICITQDYQPERKVAR